MARPERRAASPAAVRTPVLKDYSDLVQIGRGGFGVVYRARRRSDGKAVAIKMIAKNAAEERVKSELWALRNLSHSRIISYICDFVENDEHYIVMELCAEGNLRSYILRNGPLTEKGAAYILKQLLSVLNYLHTHGVVHRDLSSGNVLISRVYNAESIQVKLADFGLVTQLDKHAPAARTVVGTPGFIAPQVYARLYDAKADIYSLGAVVYTMLRARDPPQLDRPTEAVRAVREDLTRASPRLSQEAEQLILGMMTVDEKKRLTLDEVKRSQFLNKFRGVWPGEFSSEISIRQDRSLGRRTSRERLSNEDRIERERRRPSSRSPSRARENRLAVDHREDVMSPKTLLPLRRALSNPQPVRVTSRGRTESGYKSGEPSALTTGDAPRQMSAGTSNSDLPPWPLDFSDLDGFTKDIASGRYAIRNREYRLEACTKSGSVDKVLIVKSTGTRSQKIFVYRPRIRKAHRATAEDTRPISLDESTLEEFTLYDSLPNTVQFAYKKMCQVVTMARASRRGSSQAPVERVREEEVERGRSASRDENAAPPTWRRSASTRRAPSRSRADSAFESEAGPSAGDSQPPPTRRALAPLNTPSLTTAATQSFILKTTSKGEPFSVVAPDNSSVRKATSASNTFVYKDSNGKEQRFQAKESEVPSAALAMLNVLLSVSRVKVLA